MRASFVSPSSIRSFRSSLAAGWLLVGFIALCWCAPVSAQEQAQAVVTGPQPLITQAIDESQVTVLKGNTHPLARPQFDLGTAPATLPMERMLLVLKRSDAQETALRKLLDDQQDKNSPNYHKWMTPEQFGAQFGPTDADMQTITSWLQSHGFEVASQSKGRTVIEFSGSASQVQEAFHTTIHKYIVNGEQHWANANDPSIPTALAPAVAGLDSLNNFGREPMIRFSGLATREKATGRISISAKPEFTYPSSNGCNAQDSNCYAVGPYDFAAIYNVTPQWNAGIDGTGQRIAIIQETNINIADPQAFRQMFGLPANDPNIVLNGPDPGILGTGFGIETEADLDAEWSGAVAKGATIDLVVSAPTDTTAGIDLSALYVVENNLDGIVSESFGICEPAIGTSGAQFYGAIWEQAAAQGISVFVSAGDQGSAGCDPFQGAVPQPAVNGEAVNAIASTPWNVAVGGTDFQDIFNPETYWNTTNNANAASAKGYIPEATWNDTCTNALFAQAPGGSSNAETNCNNSQFFGFVTTVGGSGGASIEWTKPSWQAGTGVPNDGARDLPDASLFAADGFEGNFYIICQADASNSASCDLNSPYSDFVGVGGTSASSPAMAGIMALINQKAGSRQGNPNYVFYKLASKIAASTCNSTTGPSSNCIFNDITTGTIRVPCSTGSFDCTTSFGTDQFGVMNGYDTTTAYDLATGLGSMNVNNLVNQWSSATFTATTTSLTLNSGNPVTVTHGAAVPVQISVNHATGSGTPSGDASLIASTGPNPISGQTGVDVFTLSNGSTAAGSTTSSLPGGTYNVHAHYEGDTVFGGSDSNSVSVTVNPEGSTTTLICDITNTVLSNCAGTFDSNGNFAELANGASIPYGDMVYLHANVVGASGNGVPTGNVTFKDGASTTLGTYSLASDGTTVTPGGLFNLPAGSRSITAVYNHDASFNSSTSNALAFTITKGVTAAGVSATSTSIPSGGTTTLTTTLTLGTAALPSLGAAPTGTVSFYLNGTTLLGSPAVVGTSGSGNFLIGQYTLTTASATYTTTAGQLPDGTDTITAVYNGDANYAASPTSAGLPISVLPPDFSISAPSVAVTQGQSQTVTVTVTGQSGFNGIVGSFSCSGLPAETACSAANPTTVTGSGTTTLTITTTPLGQRRNMHRATNQIPKTGWMATAMFSLLGLCLIGVPIRRSRNASLVAMMIVAVVLLPSCGGGTHTPPNPVPSVSSLSPTQQAAGSQSQVLTINGSGFITGSTVTYNGTARAATLTSASQLSLNLTSSDMATTGTFPVVVTNPAPGGGASSPVNFNVVTGTPVGTFNVTVTATGPSTTHTATFALTVQ